MNPEWWLVDLYAADGAERRLTVLVGPLEFGPTDSPAAREKAACERAHLPLMRYDEQWSARNARQVYPPVEVGRKGEGKHHVGEGGP